MVVSGIGFIFFVLKLVLIFVVIHTGRSVVLLALDEPERSTGDGGNADDQQEGGRRRCSRLVIFYGDGRGTGTSVGSGVTYTI